MTFITGHILNNRYRIVKQIAEGGFGRIYRAWDITLQGPCALKENFDISPAAQSQFQFEARVLFRLSHPNLPKVYDHFLEGGNTPCLVMEYIEGDNLVDLMQKSNGPYSGRCPKIGWRN
jgi:serine/threonine protein kinase